MKITEEQLKTIEMIAGKLARKHTFGYFTEEDIRQEAIVIGIEGMKDYQEGRPLENFLWTHISNRLINLRRDRFIRAQKPCITCPLYNAATSSCNKFEYMEDCSLYSNWQKRNQAKSALASSFGFGDEEPDNESGYEMNIENKEIYNNIDRKIPIEYRENWIRLSNNLKLPKAKREELIEVIKGIMNE